MSGLISTWLNVLPLYTPTTEPIISGMMTMLRRWVRTYGGGGGQGQGQGQGGSVGSGGGSSSSEVMYPAVAPALGAAPPPPHGRQRLLLPTAAVHGL